MLKVLVRDYDDRPVADSDCQLTIDGRIQAVRTDAQGHIEQQIPFAAEKARLLVADLEIPILIGHLDPIEALSGQKARLNNLGYDAGPVNDAQDGLQLRSAVEEFQCDQHLTVDGICGPVTQARLLEVHGC